MLYLKADTAVTLKIGPFLDKTDGDTAETGLTIAQTNVRLSKNGGDMAQKNESTSCTHDEGGVYGCPIDGTDTNTEGRLQLWVHVTGALAVFHEYMVVNANVFDSLFAAAATDYLQVDTKQIEGGDATDALNTEVDNALNTAIPGSPTADSINERVKAIDDKLPSSSYIKGTADSDGGMDTNDKADVQSECNDALVDNNLDHLMKTAVSDRDTMPEVVDDTVLANIMTKTDGDTSDFDHATDSLEAIRDKQTDIETDTQDLQTQVGTDGAGLTNLPWNSSWDAEVQSECTDALNAYDPPTKAEMDTGHGLLATEAKQDIIDTNVDAILVDTGTTLDTIVDAILVDTGTTIPGLIAALNNVSTAEVNAEVVDALNTDTYAESSSVPAATASLVAKIAWLCTLARNKITQTSTTTTLRNDADDGSIGTSTVSDDGSTATRGEWS